MVQAVNKVDPIVEGIIQRIAQDIHPRRIILFGSRAKESAPIESDIDLLVIYDGPLSKSDVHLRMLDWFDRENIPLDIFILSLDEWENMKPIANTLAREADETGVVCYG